jgi:hypothetical protein
VAQVLACPRIKVPLVMNMLPARYIEALEQNQKIASCCRHPEDHEIEAWYSTQEEAAKGIPDIYIFHCTCGRKHRRFCVGTGSKDNPEVRAFWEVR